ncbi:MAG TPA: hypothetical protein VHM19_20820, partial [Polyangiales bacterium]|nr:hypothetical protein [Polyangiales bacterium]
LGVALGLVTPFEAQQINALQLRDDVLFGEAAVKLGLLTVEQVAELLAAQRDSHVLLGQAIETLGYLDRPAIDAGLAEFLEAASQDPQELQLPDSVRDRELATVIFDLAHKLLLRAWELPNKADLPRIEESRLTLSDRNARIALSGSTDLLVMVGVPDEAARKAAKRYSGESDPSDVSVDAVVLDFAGVLCENAASTLAERGRKVQIGFATLQGARATLPPEMRVAVVPFLTHLGQVLVGVSL